VNRSRGHLYLEIGDPRRAIECFREVLALDPKNLEANRSLALIYATCTDTALRNGDLALKHARFVCEASKFPNPQHFEILAAAYAEKGEFDAAVTAEQRAFALANVAGRGAREFERRLELFRAKKPLRMDFNGSKLRGFVEGRK